ncbi:MAG: DUF819 family protein [Flavobacteriaceae bacterium]|nr:DUF819 family protein [Flavobacteriaceae bacterium]
MENLPIISDDAVVFGLLMLILGFIFYTSNSKNKYWSNFYKVMPALLMAYLLPSILSTFGVISDAHSNLYFVASRFLLPAALVLMTLSVDLKAMFNLGPKALIMFFAGTVGIIAGGPLAVLLISFFSPETVGGAGPDAVWRGLATIAGSWIGGGPNQAAMLEIYQYNPKNYGGMVLVDIVIGNLWMAILLMGISRTEKIDKWLKADTSSIEELKKKVAAFADKVTRIPTLTDIIIILSIAFSTVGIAHFGATSISNYLVETFEIISDKTSSFSSLSSQFFWMITIATIIGIILSYTKFKSYEGAGASKIGSVFIYILVATIGMKMDLSKIVENPGLLIIGVVWMSMHVIFLLLVAKLIKAPFFFLAVGSQANVGGAASAPIVAAAFHPSLATVGVLLAVFGYAIGTYGAMLTAELMRIVSP